MKKVKFRVKVIFPRHSEINDHGEEVSIPMRIHSFSYEWKNEHYREDTEENRKVIQEAMLEDRGHGIEMRIKQIISMYQQASNAKNTDYHTEYIIDFNA